jgi:hypothetical protein
MKSFKLEIMHVWQSFKILLRPLQYYLWFRLDSVQCVTILNYLAFFISKAWRTFKYFQLNTDGFLLIRKTLISASSQGENGSSQGERMSTIDEGKRPYTLFQGHSGPVYSAAFSPFSDFLLSSSSDSTSKTSRHHYFTSVVNPFILNIYN